MLEINVKILNYNMLVKCYNKKIYDYIFTEFENFITNDQYIKYDTVINIIPWNKENINKYNFLENNFYYDFNNKELLQKLKSKSCTSWIKFEQNFRKIDICIPYKINDNKILKTFNPKFLEKWKNCLVDFFHGPFLGILEYFLLENNSTFIHGSSFCYNEKGYVFSGKAQVGKTEIVNSIKNDAKILSDDLTILSSDSLIYPYQKSIGAFIENINNNDYFKNKNFISKLLEKFNIVFFKLLGFKPKRIIFFKHLFFNRFEKENLKVNKIYFINRKTDKYSCTQLETTTYIVDMLKILENEFNNLPSFWFILNKCTNLNKQKFIKRIEKTLLKCLNSVQLIIINIPFYNDKEEFRKKIKKILFSEMKEGNN